MQETATAVVHIIEDDTDARRSLQWMIGREGYDAQAYASAEEYLDVADDDAPGCVVTDVRLPGISGVDLLKRMETETRGRPCVVLTAYGDVDTAVDAMHHGAIEFLLKPVRRKQLIDGIARAVECDGARRRTGDRRAATVSRMETLTPRERQVLGLLVGGLTNKQVAAHFGCSVRTVEVHRAHLMTKMGARQFADLILMAVEAGVAADDPRQAA